jgi:YidC/Oxa1 family membrane protein insertase
MPHLAAAITKAAITTCNDLPTNLKTSDHSIFGPIAKPIAEILAGFYSIVPNFGVAIILLSLAWMILIAPLTLKSTRSMLAMQKLQPQLKKLQAEHKNDRQAFAQAQMDLYKEHNVSPFGSCLPSILPLPVFFALFRVIDGLSHKVKVSHTLTCAVPSFLSSHTKMYEAIVAANGKIDAFGLDLSKNALSGHATFLAALPFYVLLLIMIGTQYLQTAQMMNRNPAAADNPQMKFMKYLPIIFGVVCIRFPAGVILYYAVSNMCRMAQQTAMYRYDPKVKALVNKEVIEVEANTRRIDKGGTSVSEPAPRSRFRDLLAQAQDSARVEKDKKKPPTSPGRPAVGPTNKAGAKGQPPPARSRGTGDKANPPASSGKANPNARPNPAASAGKANPNARANPSASSPKANPNARPNPAGSSGKANPNARANPAASSPKANPNARPNPPASGKTNPPPPATTNAAPKASPSAAPANGGGTTNGNGNGKVTPKDLTPAGSGDTNGTNGNGSTSGPPPAKTGGRTGAQAPRAPRRRKGR